MRRLALVALLLLFLPAAAPSEEPSPLPTAAPAIDHLTQPIDDALPPLRLPSGRPADGRAAVEDKTYPGPPVAVPYALTFTPAHQITGTFGGIPVQGVYYGVGSEGVFTLTVDGKALAMGTYECMRGECSIVAEEVLGRPKSFLIFTNSLTGTFRGTLRGLYPSRGSWVSSVTRWAQANLEAPLAAGVIVAAARLGSSARTP